LNQLIRVSLFATRAAAALLYRDSPAFGAFWLRRSLASLGAFKNISEQIVSPRVYAIAGNNYSNRNLAGIGACELSCSARETATCKKTTYESN
jgi:hypothetical protein